MFVADPITTGLDERELGWYVTLSITSSHRGRSPASASTSTTRTSDVADARAGKLIPLTETVTTYAPLIGFQIPHKARLVGEWDIIHDAMARNVLGDAGRQEEQHRDDSPARRVVMRALALGLLTILGSCLLGCGDSQSAPSGLDEPVRIVGGQFIEGSFPKATLAGPPVSTISIRDLDLLEGASGKSVTGLASPGSLSVAIALQGLGHGYWVVPVGSEDLAAPGFFDWGASLSFSTDVPGTKPALAVRRLRMRTGNSEPVTTQTLFLKSPGARRSRGRVPHLGCPTRISICTWSYRAAKSCRRSIRTRSLPMPTASPCLARACSNTIRSLPAFPDGLRTENVVWADAPLAGTYSVYVDMFSACGSRRRASKFSLLVDGQSVLEKAGRLLDIDADGGATSGLFVTQFTCDEGTGTCS